VRDADGIHEKYRRVAGYTADILTRQLLILEFTCVLLPSVTTAVPISAFSSVVLFLYIHLSWIGMNSGMLTVVYFSMLQHKLVLLLAKRTFTGSVSVGVMIADKVNWLPANRSTFTMRQQHLILSATKTAP